MALARTLPAGAYAFRAGGVLVVLPAAAEAAEASPRPVAAGEALWRPAAAAVDLAPPAAVAPRPTAVSPTAAGDDDGLMVTDLPARARRSCIYSNIHCTFMQRTAAHFAARYSKSAKQGRI